MASRKLFINYRRDDSRADAGRLYDRLQALYPDRVFRDVGSLEPGVDWHTAIERVLGSSDACVVVIGPRWLSIADANGKRRLDDPRDTVRKEVSTALANGMRVFPVLVGGAKMPPEEDLPEELQSLARRNALEITEQDFDEDVTKLARAIERTLGWTPKASSAPKSHGAFIAGAAAAVIIGIVSFFVVLNFKPPSPSGPTPPAASNSNQPPVSTGSQASASNPSSGSTPTKATGVTNDVKSQAPVVPQEPEPAQTPPPAPRRVVRVVGNWRAVVTANGQQINERVEVYPDSSFRVTLDNNALAAVGRWRQDGAEGIEVVDAVNFLNNRVRFSCRYRPDDDGLQGSCTDRQQNRWIVALTNVRALPEVPAELPAVDFSGSTMAERASFIQLLSSELCVCSCGMDMHSCLLKDRTCPQSPGRARQEWALFLQLVRA
jgi:TIR domain-containing protein